MRNELDDPMASNAWRRVQRMCFRGRQLTWAFLVSCLLSTLQLSEAQHGPRVFPEGGHLTVRQPDGQFDAEARIFTIGNPSAKLLRWRVEFESDWIDVSPVQGSLQHKGRAPVTVSLISEAVAALAPGRHRALLNFRNMDGGKGVTTREFVVIIRGDGGLELEGSQELVLYRNAPGSARGAALEERLHNGSSSPIDWSASSLEPWLSVEPSSGRLAPGEDVVVEYVWNSAALEGQGLVHRRGGVAFSNEVDGTGSTLRIVRLAEGSGPATGEPDQTDPPRQPRGGSRHVSHISQFGVTWTFDREYEAGRFANGDWWVLGPVMLVAIDPPSKGSAPRAMNGSMVNPSPLLKLAQGYDSATYGKYKGPRSYRPKLNAALDVSSMQPLFLPTHTSLISSISHPKAGERPQLTGAAILTVLDQPAPTTAFRPPYCGTDKTLLFSTDQLDRSRLLSLQRVDSAPAWKSVERMFTRPWIDHVPDWLGRYVHPSDNMSDYGRELADSVSTAALLLHTNVSIEKKERLLVSFVQLGIDLFGILEEGGVWSPNGGHMSGRKWPILFAGLMLGSQKMQDIGKAYGPATFGEDGQTYYIEEPRPTLGYSAAHVGLPEWGSFHATEPEKDDARWNSGDRLAPGARPDKKRQHGVKYRLCCTANTWWGELLAARIMGAQALWNHDALFDYQDRFFKENRQRRISDYRMRWRPFYFDMWVRYRERY